MNSNTFAIVVCMYSSIVCSCAMADVASEYYPSSYSVAIHTALTNRIELAIESTKINRSEARIDEAKGAYLPSINALSTFERSNTYDTYTGVSFNAVVNGTPVSVTPVRIAPHDLVTTSLQLNYNIYSGGADSARLGIAVAENRRAVDLLNQEKLKVVLDVTAAYWALCKEQLTYRIWERKLDISQREKSIANDKFTNGNISQIELDAKALAVDTAQTELDNEKRNQLDLQRRYIDALGFDVATIDNAPLSLTFKDPTDLDLDNIFASLNLHPALGVAIAQTEMESAVDKVDVARAEYKPSVDLFANYNSVGRGNNTFDEATGNFVRDSASIGIRVKWNLFDGYRTDSRVTQAQAEAQEMQLRVEQTKHNLINSWHQKVARENNTRAAMNLARKQLALANAQLQIAKARWETNSISELEYQTAQLNAEQAAVKVATANIDLLTARIETEFARIE